MRTSARLTSWISITQLFDSWYAISYWWFSSVNIFQDICTKVSEKRPWPFTVTWQHQARDHLMHQVPFPIDDPFLVCISSCLRHNGSQTYWVTILTFWGHVTSSITWPFDSLYAISYQWSSGTKPLTPFLGHSALKMLKNKEPANQHDGSQR